MITLLSAIVLLFLAVISFIDIKYKEIPSIILTGIIFVVLFFNFNNLQFGLIAFVLAYMLYEGGFISGIADIKMITLVGLMMNSYFYFAVFVILLLVLGMAVKLYMKYKNKDTEFAFIPIISICYALLLLAGGIAL